MPKMNHSLWMFLRYIQSTITGSKSLHILILRGGGGYHNYLNEKKKLGRWVLQTCSPAATGRCTASQAHVLLQTGNLGEKTAGSS